MPYIYEQKRPLGLKPQQQSLVQRQSSAQTRIPTNRLSAIPRSTKQVAVNHASRPTPEPFPAPTPSKDPNHTRVLTHIEPTKPPTMKVEQARDHAQRQSVYSRPTKHLAINHASKPTPEPFPAPTPSKDQRRSKAQIRNQPPKTPTLKYDPELALLELKPFSVTTFVGFGDVELGTTRVNFVIIRNSLNFPQQLVVKSLPKQEIGLTMDATEFILAPRTEICVALAWTPNHKGSMRESIHLQDVKRMSWKIVLTGAAHPKPALSVKRARNVPRFLRSPFKVKNQVQQESRRALFSPRTAVIKPTRSARPICKLHDQTPSKRHQLVRKMLSRDDQQMAIRIQSYFRMILERRRFEHTKAIIQATIIIQHHVRRFIAKRRVQKLERDAATCIQKRIRGFLARREYQLKRKSVIIIQTMVRSYLVQIEYRKLCTAALIIQRYYRGSMVRRDLQRKRRAATAIQSAFRSHNAQKRFREMRAAAIIIQKHTRGHLAKRDYQAKKRASIVLQSAIRGHIARAQFQRKRAAVLVIQKYHRCHVARRDYEAKRKATIVIQSKVRAHIARQQFLRTRSAVVVIQRYLRGCAARRDFQAKREAAIVIQSAVRAHIAQANYRKTRAATLVAQKYIRGFLVRREYQAKRDAAIKIQSHVRRYLVRGKYLETVAAVENLRCTFKRLTGRACKHWLPR